MKEKIMFFWLWVIFWWDFMEIQMDKDFAKCLDDDHGNFGFGVFNQVLPRATSIQNADDE